MLQRLDKQTDNEVEAAWDEELHRRREEIISGEIIPIPADVAIQKAREALKCRK